MQCDSPLHILKKFEKSRGGWREQFLAAMNDSNGADQVRHVERNRSKDAIFDLTRDARTRKNTDARVQGYGLFDRFNVVKLHGGFDFPAALAHGLVDRFADRQILLESDKRLVGQIGHRDEAFLRQRMGAMTDEH